MNQNNLEILCIRPCTRDIDEAIRYLKRNKIPFQFLPPDILKFKSKDPEYIINSILKDYQILAAYFED